MSQWMTFRFSTQHAGKKYYKVLRIGTQNYVKQAQASNTVQIQF